MMTRDSKQRGLLSVFRMGLSPMGRIIACHLHHAADQAVR